MCAVSENILNLKEIYSNRSHYHQWVNNLGEVFLPGFGDSSVLKGTDINHGRQNVGGKIL